LRQVEKGFTFILEIALLCLCFSSLIAAAEEQNGFVHEMRLGVLDHDTDNLWSGFSRENGIDINAELVFSPKLNLLNGVIRPNLGVTINTEGDTSKLYAGGVWEYVWPNDVFFDIGIGLAVHDGETETLKYAKKELGSNVLLRFVGEVGYSFVDRYRLSLMFDHISNGYTASPNEGLDTLGIRYAFIF